jgi:IS5 family transposase
MGLFPPGKGGGDDVAYGFKGKGVTQHLLTDGRGMPLAVITTSAASGERAQVINLLAQVRVFGSHRTRPRSSPDELQADKGYDSKELRNDLRNKGIKPLIPRREWKNRKQLRGPKPAGAKDRWKVERCFAWMWLTRLLYGT